MDPTLTPGAMPAHVTAAGARAITACDDFNRPAGQLGPDWVTLSGTPDIYSDMLGGLSGNAYLQHATASVNYDSAVISFDLPDNPQTLRYGAALHGLGGTDNTFTKIQSQTVGFYNTIGFYHGLNAGGIGTYGGFFTITNFTGGHVDVYVDPNSAGDTMVVDIDENRDGVVDYSYTSSGLVASVVGMGTSIGVGVYSNAFGSMDDFELNGGCGPQSPTLQVTQGAPGGLMDFRMLFFGASENIALVYGPAGSVTGSTPCGSVTLDLVPNNYPSNLIIVPADPNGIGLLIGIAVPFGATGLSVQAVGTTTCGVSNPIVL